MVIEITGLDLFSQGEHQDWAKNKVKDVTPPDKE